MRAFLFLALLILAPSAVAQSASLSGTVVDASGATLAGAHLSLRAPADSTARETLAGPNGDFSFPDVAPGPFSLTISAKGFAAKTIDGKFLPGQPMTLAAITLTVETLNTEVNVTQTQVEIADAQIHIAEQQRLIGLVPNYFVSYEQDAAPLNVRQKFELTWKTFLDPSSFVITGAIAGTAQARSSYKGFGQGAQGYAKRYGASYLDFVTSLALESVVLTTVFKQDPRYFYKGTGSTQSRVIHAVSRSVLCRGDNKRTQFCYSSFIARFASGALTNLYYPSADRNGAGTIIQNGAIGIGADALGNLFQEFVARRITRRKP